MYSKYQWCLLCVYGFIHVHTFEIFIVNYILVFEDYYMYPFYVKDYSESFYVILTLL